MSIRETYTLAHTARCKLHMHANRPDRNLRFLVGHALAYDSLRLRIMEIEEGIQQPGHAEQVKFKGAGNEVAGDHLPAESPMVKHRARNPPPPARPAEDEDEDDDDDEGLGLTRFPSGTARPSALESHDDNSSSSDSDEELPPPVMRAARPDPAILKLITKQKGDELLASLYRSIKKCPCQDQHAHAPDIEQIWELPQTDGEKGGGIRTAVAEIKVSPT